MTAWPTWRVQPCGTPAAFRRHYRNGQKPCQACREAFNLYQQRVTDERRRRKEAKP